LQLKLPGLPAPKPQSASSLNSAAANMRDGLSSFFPLVTFVLLSTFDIRFLGPFVTQSSISPQISRYRDRSRHHVSFVAISTIRAVDAIVNSEGDLITPTPSCFDGEGDGRRQWAIKAIASEANHVALCASAISRAGFFIASSQGPLSPRASEAWVLNKISTNADAAGPIAAGGHHRAPPISTNVRLKATQDAGYMAGLEG